MHVVVVGNGVAGIEAARAVRERHADWAISLVSEETDHFVSRTALMYVLAGQLAYRDIEPYERDLYAQQRFTRVRARVTRLDPVARELHLHDGRRVPYDRLLIASGSRPRPAPWPGAELVGVGHFVTIQDLEWLESALYPDRPGVDRPPNARAVEPIPDSPYALRPAPRSLRNPVVIGGGLIGIEVAETLVAAGHRPVFVVREDWFWPIALDAREAEFVTEALRAHGVDVRLGANVRALRGRDGALAEVELDSGTVPADLAVIAIGVVPNTGWLGDAVNRDAAGGIVVDDQLRTSAPGVWAAGDCASVPWSDGSVRPEPLWYTARDQGRVAGRQLAGEAANYRRGTWYNSAKLMDVEYTTVGRVNQAVPGEQSWFYEERGAVHSTTRIVHLDGTVIGMNFLGRRWDHAVCARWIEDQRDLRYVLAHLDEARFDTEFVPRLRVPELA